MADNTRMNMDPRKPRPIPAPGVGVVVPNWTMGLGFPHPPVVRPSTFPVNTTSSKTEVK